MFMWCECEVGFLCLSMILKTKEVVFISKMNGDTGLIECETLNSFQTSIMSIW